MPSSIIVVFHKDCKASTDFIVLVSKLQDYEVEYIDLKTDKFETDIVIDVVPLIIIDNKESNIYKGKDAFNKIEELIKNPPKKQVLNSLKYDQATNFIADTAKGSNGKIDLDSSRKSR
jgi:hypothetical protein